MGIGSEATNELDILVGYPEHRLLFIATQVARAAGLKDPKRSTKYYRNTAKGKVGIQVHELMESKVEDSTTLSVEAIRAAVSTASCSSQLRSPERLA